MATTLTNIVEMIRQVFPDIGDTQIVIEADKAQKYFAQKTKVLTAEVALTSVSSNLTFSVPSDFLSLYRVDFYDTNSDPIYMDDKNLGYDVEHEKITFFSTTSTPLDEIPTDIIYIHLQYYKSPTSLSTIASSLTVDEEFYDAVIARLFEQMYARFPVSMMDRSGNVVKAIDWTGVKYWGGQFEILAREAKKKRFDKSDFTSREAVMYTDPAKTHLAKRTKRTLS